LSVPTHDRSPSAIGPARLSRVVRGLVVPRRLNGGGADATGAHAGGTLGPRPPAPGPSPADDDPDPTARTAGDRVRPLGRGEDDHRAGDPRGVPGVAAFALAHDAPDGPGGA